MGRVWRRWCDPVAAEMALRTLERAGHGELVTEPAEGGRGRPSFRFRLFDHPEHPAVDQNAQTPGIENIVNGPVGDATAGAAV